MVCPTEFAEANRIKSLSHAPVICGAALQGLVSGTSAPEGSRCNDELLATVCHELRNPLASMRYAARLLASPTQGAATKARTLASLERQILHMTGLVDDLLDLSSSASGHPRLHKQRVDLRVVVSQAIESMMGEVKARRHRLTIALPEAPVWLMADSLRLERVFVNLLANAAKYTDPGGRIAVEVRARGDRAIVQVRDSGVGIAPQLLSRVFDLFRQANEADPRSASGLGIGLAVVRNHVEQHGGSVVATSRGRGQGSEFTVHLPREG